MIPDAAVKRIARRLGVDPMVVDLDHALGVVLWALSDVTLTQHSWIFKGGTCLRKAYFGDYRFSEDLDFTVMSRVRTDEVRSVLEEAARSSRNGGVELLVAEARISIVNDDYGRESLEVLVPYRGALRRRGVPRNLQLHLSADEEVLLDVVRRQLIHPYDDGVDLACSITCYSPEEMLAEKLRAVGGQRLYAISRDIYDVAQLVARGADMSAALAILPDKAARKSVDLSLAASRFLDRREEYKADWDRALTYLVSENNPDFDAAYETTARLLGRVADS